MANKPTIGELSRMLAAIQKTVSIGDPSDSIQKLMDIGLSFNNSDGKDCIILLLGMLADRGLQMATQGKSAYEQIMTEVAARSKYAPDEFDDVLQLMQIGIERYDICMTVWQHISSKKQVELMKKHFPEAEAAAKPEAVDGNNS